MAGVARRLALLVALTVAVGSGFPSASVARPPAGLNSQVIPAYGISVDVPTTWYPELGPPGSPVAYYFIAPDDVFGFRANLSLIVVRLPHGMTLKQWMAKGPAASYLRYGTLTRATVAGRPGLHFHSTGAFKFGARSLLTDEYDVVRNGRVFIFTYSALASMRGLFEPVFRESAHSIRFGAHPPPVGAYGG